MNYHKLLLQIFKPFSNLQIVKILRGHGMEDVEDADGLGDAAEADMDTNEDVGDIDDATIHVHENGWDEVEDEN